MTHNPNLFSFVLQAGLIVKFVLLLLVFASITSWTIIIQRWRLFRQMQRLAVQFEQDFWSGIDLHQFYSQQQHKPDAQQGLAVIFQAGFEEFTKLQKLARNPNIVVEGSKRAMHIAMSKELMKLEQHLALLATIGSTSPYVGLFGTVWGIMTSFQSLGTATQATLAAVAPGISEALIATAIGLFAAIPAVIAYNRFGNQLDRLAQHYEIFQEEFSNLLQRQLQAASVVNQ